MQFGPSGWISNSFMIQTHLMSHMYTYNKNIFMLISIIRSTNHTNLTTKNKKNSMFQKCAILNFTTIIVNNSEIIF